MTLSNIFGYDLTESAWGSIKRTISNTMTALGGAYLGLELSSSPTLIDFIGDVFLVVALLLVFFLFVTYVERKQNGNKMSIIEVYEDE